MNIRIFVALLGLCLLLASVGCMASVGARPLAMGGAFVGLADDANATFWNPAGLALLSQPEATWTHTATNRDINLYQDYLAYAMKLQRSNVSLGFSYLDGNLPFMSDSQRRLWVSGAYPLQGGYAGINVRVTDDSRAGVHTDMGFDLSYLRLINERWSVGILLQDINEPQTKGGPVRVIWARNVQPGVAFRYDRSSVFTADIVDLLNRGGIRAIRLGGERLLKNGMAVRAGYSGNTHGLTFGAGGKVGRTQVDAALLTGGLDDTLMLSATSKF